MTACGGSETVVRSPTEGLLRNRKAAPLKICCKMTTCDLKESDKVNTVGAGIAIGAGVGAALGVAMGNIAVGVGVGIAIGAAIGAVMQKKDH